MKKKKSFSNEAIVFLAVVLLLYLFSQFVIYHFNSNIIRRQTEQANSNLILQLVDRLDQHHSSARAFVDTIVETESLQDFFAANNYMEKGEKLNTVYGVMENYTLLNSNIQSIVFFDSENLYDNRDTRGSYEQIRKLNSQFVQNPALPMAGSLNLDTGKYSYAIKADIFDHQAIGRRAGACMLVMNLDDIELSLHEMQAASGGLILIADAMGQVALSNQPEYCNATVTADGQIIMKGSGKTLKFEDSLTVSQRSQLSGWTVLCMTPYDQLLADLNASRNLSILIGLLFIGFFMLLYFGFFREVIAFVGLLCNRMGLVGKGNLDIRIEQSFDNEFQVVADGFNGMMDTLVQLTDDNLRQQSDIYERELAARRANLVALRSQINPHFLYNTLECIGSMGIYHHVPEVGEMCTSLANMFRYSIKGDSEVAVSEELTSLQSYVKIQQYRFWDRFDVIYNVPEALLTYRIPKMVLQPLVENAISHGVCQRPSKGRITVNVWQEQQVLRLSVTDDAKNMTPEKLAELRATFEQQLDEIATDSIGLQNINSRVRLMYGKQYGLDISQDKQGDTVATVSVPAREEGVQHV
ncbi:MAG: histidine kinase [Angelakisella sp.]